MTPARARLAPAAATFRGGRFARGRPRGPDRHAALLLRPVRQIAHPRLRLPVRGPGGGVRGGGTAGAHRGGGDRSTGAACPAEAADGRATHAACPAEAAEARTAETAGATCAAGRRRAAGPTGSADAAGAAGADPAEAARPAEAAEGGAAGPAGRAGTAGDDDSDRAAAAFAARPVRHLGLLRLDQERTGQDAEADDARHRQRDRRRRDPGRHRGLLWSLALGAGTVGAAATVLGVYAASTGQAPSIPPVLLEANDDDARDAQAEILAPLGYRPTQPDGFAPYNYLFVV